MTGLKWAELAGLAKKDLASFEEVVREAVLAFNILVPVDGRVPAIHTKSTEQGSSAMKAVPTSELGGEVHLLVKSDRNRFAGMITIGRASTNDICIPVPSVSKAHACVRKNGGGWWVHDLRATNRSTIDGATLEPGGNARLVEGATLTFGPDVHARFFTPAGLYEVLRDRA